MKILKKIFAGLDRGIKVANIETYFAAADFFSAGADVGVFSALGALFTAINLGCGFFELSFSKSLKHLVEKIQDVLN